MFIARLLTSLILVPLVLITIFYAPIWFLGGLLAVILLLAAGEYIHLIPLDHWALKTVYLIIIIIGLWACGHLFTHWLMGGLLLWVFLCMAIVSFPKSQQYWGYRPIVAVVGLLLLPLFIQSLIHLYYMPQGKALLVYLLFLIWAADIGAYLAGKQWGKHKLIPQVSPGKSWEGVSGGLILSMSVAICAYLYFKPIAGGYWFGLAFCTVILSIFGDLFISILKRRCHLKDTGSLIPGHGGILDRLDSLIAALPLFYLGLTYI